MQLFLFGYAINTNPQHLPTGLLMANPRNTSAPSSPRCATRGYYDIRTLQSEAEAEHALAERRTAVRRRQFPPNFDRAVDRGEFPSILIDADATDPSAIGNATAALGDVDERARSRPAAGPRRPTPTPPFQFVVHARYNPEQITALNIVPGLICIVVMMSTLFMTTLAITSERERGTMENLLAMPVRPIEVMLAKMIPYMGIGYLQVLFILAASSLFFQLPMRGSVCCAARCPRRCSSPAIWRSASPSPRLRPTRCRRSSSRSSR